MAMRQFFIGATFYPNHLVTQRIDAFRQRYDSKYTHASELIMSLLPPFQMRADNYSEAAALCEDIMDTHLRNSESDVIEFTSVDFHASDRGTVLLRPAPMDDLFHCCEEMAQALVDSGAHFRLGKGTYQAGRPMGQDMARDFFRLGLPVARGHDIMAVHEAIAQAVEDFRLPVRLQFQDITWFEKLPGHWPKRRRIFTFAQGPTVFARELDGSLK